MGKWIGMVAWTILLAVLIGLAPPPAMAQEVVEVTYYLNDAQGTPVAMMDEDGNIIARFEYEPYGLQISGPVTDGPGYTGHVEDIATGLVYMQQRYYDPLGRFLSRDAVTAYEKPLTNFNVYVYALNNPYRFTDPDGRDTVGELIDQQAMAAASNGSNFATYGWALAGTAWGFLGSENISQIADGGVSGASKSQVAGAGMEIMAALPPIKILGEVAAIGKEVAATARAASGPVFATTKEATKAAESMGFTRVKETVSGQAVYKRGNDYITRDVTGHNGGAWKVASSVKELASKETRSGTFSADLKKRIGE